MKVSAGAVLIAVAIVATPAAAQTARQFLDANCKTMTAGCTDPVVKALDAAATAGKIPPKCVAGRPPKQAMALDIVLWWVGHHDLDAKPFADAAVTTAERLWPCSRAQ
ncbi:MAG TPA: hypothetical protein VMU08_18635 [Rhizomicrobium sp.]|nr:hypothetical protein [Rhizomicrobium sp.]